MTMAPRTREYIKEFWLPLAVGLAIAVFGTIGGAIANHQSYGTRLDRVEKDIQDLRTMDERLRQVAEDVAWLRGREESRPR